MLPTPRRMAGYPSCIALTIEFNRHAVYYQTVEAWMADEHASGRDVAWVSPEEQARAIETDSVWICQWYPDTPVGSCELAASTYQALMAAVTGGAE